MSAAGRRGFAGWMLLVNVAFGGLAGGGMAVGVLWLLHQGLVYPRLTLALVVLVAVLGVVATAALQSDGRHPEPVGSTQRRQPAPPVQAPPPSRTAPLAAAAPEPWYSSASRAAAEGRPAPAATPVPATSRTPLPLPAPEPEPSGPPPTVDEYEVPGSRRAGARRARRVVQCPACGDFAVEVYRVPPSFVFTCRPCDHRWKWAPGEPWPATVVRPPVSSPRPS